MIYYEVLVARREIRTHTFRIQADSPEEAQDRAQELLDSHVFSADSVTFATEEIVNIDKKACLTSKEREAVKLDIESGRLLIREVTEGGLDVLNQ